MNDSYKDKILSFYDTHKRMPSYTEIMKLVGFKSKNSVAKLVEKLIEQGIVEKDRQGKLVPLHRLNEIPLLGLVEAGFPSPAEEAELDTMSLDEYLIKHKEATYLLEVKGESMIDAHIAPGDLVIADRRGEPRDGDIVIAEVDGDWTMKYYRRKGVKIWLEPANRKFRPIFPQHELRVAAIVRGVVRKYHG